MILSYIQVLQEESERVCGRHLPEEIVLAILYRWGGLQTPAAVLIRKRMNTPLFEGRPESVLVPCVSADLRRRGWVEGMLASTPENPAYDISMVLSSDRFMFPHHGQQSLADGRVVVWRVSRVPKTDDREPFPWRRSWMARHPATYWEAAAVANGMDAERAKTLVPLCAPPDMATAWAIYRQVDIEPGKDLWIPLLTRLRFTFVWEHLWRNALAMVLCYALFVQLYGMSQRSAAMTTGVFWMGASAMSLWVERTGRRLLGHAGWEELRDHYARRYRYP